MEQYNPYHAGEALRLHMADAVTVSDLARHLGMTRANLSMILNGRLGISATVALKLAEAFPKTSARFWLTLQLNYDLARARRKRRTKIKPVLKSSKPLQVLKKAA